MKTRYWEKYFNGKVKSEGEQLKRQTTVLKLVLKLDTI